MAQPRSADYGAGVRGEVTVEMKAGADRIWALLSDVTRIGSYSPETFEAEWLNGATGPEVGAHFRGHVRRNGRGPVYWTECRVVDCEPGRSFGFEVVVGGRAVNTWRYRLEPRGDGATAVTESFQLEANPLNRIYWTLLGWARGKANEKGMRQTLERVRAEVEKP